MSLAQKVLSPAFICVAIAGSAVGSILGPELVHASRYGPKIIRDKPYFTGESTSAYSPITQPGLVPSTISVTDDRYVVARRRLDNGRTGVSITPLARGDDAHWFELLDLDGDHTTVEKKVVGKAEYRPVHIPVVAGTNIYFTPIKVNVASIPTEEDHSLLQRLVKHARIE